MIRRRLTKPMDLRGKKVLLIKLRYIGDTLSVAVEIQNFGQVASKPTPVRIVNKDNGQSVATGTIPPLKPFEKTILEFAPRKVAEPPAEKSLTVIIDPLED